MGCSTDHRNRIDRFLSTPYYIIAAAVLSFAAHVCSLELATYTVFAAVAVYVGFCGNDLLPVTPLFLFCYIIPSAANNPGRSEESIFFGIRGIWILFLGIAIIAAMVAFVLRNRKTFFSSRPRLIPGMLVLCGAYLLSGIGSAAYPTFLKQNLLYCVLQCLCLAVPYWLLQGGIRWDQSRNEQLGWLGVCGGFLLLLELTWCYLTGGVIENGTIVRTRIFTGWGMYNNIGAMLAMMLPFAFSLGLGYKKELLGIFCGSIFMGGILLTCSRASILAGSLIFLACLVLTVCYSKKRKMLFAVVFSLACILLVCYFLLKEELLHLFSDLIRRGADPNTRDEIYKEGFALFKEAPIWGNSFFSPGYVPWDFSTVDAFSSFIPPRWCNTVVQLLVSAGVVGLIAYLVHRVDTLVLFVKRRRRQNSFILCSIIVLLITSLLDCHFFNLGPVLFYSAMLAFADKEEA